MSIQSINANVLLPSKQNSLNHEKNLSNNSTNYASKDKLSATITSSYYSSKSISMEYTSSDGDTVSFSYESMEYSKSVMQLQAETDPEKIMELAKKIKDEIWAMKNELMRILFGDAENVKKSEEPKKLEIPEYWNAENTSQRIVDFAVSFNGIVNVGDEEYYNKMKAAIEDGFQQARDIIGELPDEIEALVNDTFDLTMQKLDMWAQEKGIKTDTAIS